MKSKIFSAAAILCAGVMTFSSCGTDKTTVNSGNEQYDGTYPIKTEETLTWYIPLESNAAQSVKNLGETAFAKELERQTGVKIEYIHPSSSGTGEQFNLMLSSEELPDLISHYWVDFPGGPGKAIQDGYIQDVTELLENNAPNYMKILEEHPEYKKYVMTDDEKMFGFPAIIAANAPGGLIIRQDWLDELGLEMPQTISDWENVLTQFKEKKGASAPLSCDTNPFRNGAFAGAYGLQLDWYVDNDEMKYGYYEDSYKDFLTLMHSWYEKGLYDNNFSTSDAKTFSANIMNGNSGAAYGGITSGIGLWNSSKQSSEPDYKVVSAPWPVKNKGEKAEFGQLSSDVSVFYTAISTSCKNPELAARVLDFTYSYAGQMIYNYGVEGESYTMVDGKPKFTDKILHPEGDKTVGQVLSYYAKPYNTYNSVQIYDAYEQTLLTDEMRNALTIWGDTNEKEHLYPPIYPTSDEQAKLSSLQNSIDTYVKEMFIKFVMGVEPIDNFEKYKQTLDKMGMQELLQIENTAYKRAKNR